MERNTNSRILVLLDIDGTVLSMDYSKVRDKFKSVFAEVFEVDVDKAKLPEFSGQTDLGILKYIADSIGVPFHEVLVKKKQFWNVMYSRFAPMYNPENVYLHENSANVIKHINESEKYHLGFLTGNSEKNAIGKLGVHFNNLDYKVGVYGCDHHDRNALPRIAWDRLNSDSPEEFYRGSNTLIVGDSPKDISCAKSSGSKVIAVATGKYSVEDLKSHSPDYVCDTLPSSIGLDQIVKELFTV